MFSFLNNEENKLLFTLVMINRRLQKIFLIDE